MKRLLPIFLIAVAALGGDWVTGGGNPRRNCIADVPGPDTTFVRWQTSLNGSYGQPVFIWEDKLVTYRYDFTNGPVVCHDIATGQTLWTRDLGQPGGRSQPVGFRDGQVYAVEFDGTYPDTLYALADSDGSTTWKARLQAHMYITESVNVRRERRPHRQLRRLHYRAHRLADRRHGLDYRTGLAGVGLGGFDRFRFEHLLLRRRAGRRVAPRVQVRPRDRPQARLGLGRGYSPGRLRAVRKRNRRAGRRALRAPLRGQRHRDTGFWRQPARPLGVRSVGRPVRAVRPARLRTGFVHLLLQ